jgi:hypothetical protein
VKVGGLCPECGASVEMEFRSSAEATIFVYCRCTGEAGVFSAPGYTATPMVLLDVPSEA